MGAKRDPGLSLIIGLRKIHSSIMFPVILLQDCLVLPGAGVDRTSLQEARGLGLLLEMESGITWQPLNLTILRAANWQLSWNNGQYTSIDGHHIARLVAQFDGD